MAGAVNIIQKQVLHFQYNGRADGLTLQKEVSDWCKHTLIPELEQQLEVFALDDEYITIDKLDIGASIGREGWQQKIKDELLFNLKNKLNNYKPSNKSTASKKLDELILFYFEKGYLPWWGKALVPGDLDSLLKDWAAGDISVSRAEFIGGQLKHIASKPVVERIFNQFHGPLYFQFLKNLFKYESEQIGQLESFFKEVMPGRISVPKQKAIAGVVNKALLSMLIASSGKADTRLLLHVFYEELVNKKALPEISEPAPVKKDKTFGPVYDTWQKLLLDETTGKEQTDTGKKQSRLKYNKTVDGLISKDPDKINAEDKTAALQEGLFIENAGAVIVAAFLPALFSKLKIEKNAAIVKPSLATMLIQYLVTGNKKNNEYELVLPKILCGIDPELPVNTNHRIPAAHEKEVEAMLESVIEYWAVIKDTSITGLRESFLKRNGKLSMLNNEWLLQVEQKPYDMLLQQLPWSISMIKLPWMKTLLKTEWI
jgi:hypothetical protein